MRFLEEYPMSPSPEDQFWSGNASSDTATASLEGTKEFDFFLQVAQRICDDLKGKGILLDEVDFADVHEDVRNHYHSETRYEQYLKKFENRFREAKHKVENSLSIHLELFHNQEAAACETFLAFQGEEAARSMKRIRKFGVFGAVFIVGVITLGIINNPHKKNTPQKESTPPAPAKNSQREIEGLSGIPVEPSP